MTAKILTVIPLLVLSGLFFAAGIVEGGILFVVFAAVVLIAYLRAGVDEPPPRAMEAPARQAGADPGPGGRGLPS